MDPLKRMFVIAVAFFVLSVLTAKDTLAQCVDCVVTGSGQTAAFECSASKDGGFSCVTTATSCTLKGVCKGKPGNFAPIDQINSVVASIDTISIQEIAALNMRFAATLGTLKNINNLEGYNQMYWMPIEVTSEDVEQLLKQDQSVVYLEKLQKRIQRASHPKIVPVVYEVIFKQLDGSPEVVLQIQVSKGSAIDPPHSSLEITFINQGEKIWKMSGWKIK